MHCSLMLFPCVLLSLWAYGGASSSFTFQAKVVAVGMDNWLYAKRNFSASNSWVRIPRSCCVTRAHSLKSGAILGVSKDKHLYIKKSLFAEWSLVPKSCCVSDVTTMTFKGQRVFVGLADGGKKLFMKKRLNADWRGSFRAPNLIAVTGAGKKLFGLSAKRGVLVRHGLRGRWTRVTQASGILDIFSNKKSLYGVTPSHSIVTKKAGKWNSAWRQIKGSCCVQSFGLLRRTVNAKVKLIGVGMNNQLYFKQHLDSTWGYVPRSGSVKSITVLRDGRLVGIGMDRSLYYRLSMEDSTWKKVADSCCVKSVTELKGGKIVGVGMNNHLWERPALVGKWTRKDDDSCGVTGVTALADGSLVGIGVSGGLFRKPSLGKPWTGPLGNSLDQRLIDIKYSFEDGYLYGVTDRNKVVKKSCPEIDSDWESISSNDCCVFSIAVR